MLSEPNPEPGWILLDRQEWYVKYAGLPKKMRTIGCPMSDPNIHLVSVIIRQDTMQKKC
jgi:hypothetical protein